MYAKVSYLQQTIERQVRLDDAEAVAKLHEELCNIVGIAGTHYVDAIRNLVSAERMVQRRLDVAATEALQ